MTFDERDDDLSGFFEALAKPTGLRPYQVDAIARVNRSIAAGVRRIMLQSATGSGKTLIASAMIAERARDKPAIFTVPSIELVDQTLEKFHLEGIHDVGVMQAQHRRTDSTRPIQIASVQTLMRREIPPAELVFVDEKSPDFHLLWKMVHRCGLEGCAVYRLECNAMGEGSRPPLPGIDYCGDHARSHRARLPVQVSSLCARAS